MLLKNEELLTELTSVWMSLLDYHKDRDCHFHISKAYSYGSKPVYKLYHYGYVAEEFDKVFGDMDSAERWLIRRLLRMLTYQVKYINEVAENDGIDRDYFREHYQATVNTFGDRLEQLKKDWGVRT